MSAGTEYPTVSAAQINSIPGFSVVKSANQAAVAAGVHVITFDVEQWDVDACFASNRHTPKLAGRYNYQFNLTFDTAIPAAKTLQVFYRKNGSVLYAVASHQGYVSVNGSREIPMVVGDYTELIIFHDLVTSIIFTAGPADQNGTSFFQGTWNGP